MIASIFAAPVEIAMNSQSSNLSIQVEDMSGIRVDLAIGNIYLEEIEVSSRLTLQHHKGIGLQSVRLSWFRLVPVRSPLLGEYQLISFPPGT